MFKGHSCGDSMLKCIDCDAQICPKCMTQCPVGNRCPKCTGKFTSHILKLTPWIVARTFAVALIFGGAFAFLHPFLSWGGFFAFIITYFVGIFSGNLLHQVSGHKMGKQIAAVSAAGILIGSFACSTLSGDAAIGFLFNNPSQKRVVKPKKDSATVEKEGELEARRRWPEFLDAYNHRTKKEEDDFWVKAPVTEKDQSEPLWIMVREIDKDQLTGVLMQKPEKLDTTRYGDKVQVSVPDIDDWRYRSGQNYKGNFTVQADEDDDEDAAETYQAASRVGYGSYRFGSMMLDLILYILGVITPFMGWVPPIRLPWSRY